MNFRVRTYLGTSVYTSLEDKKADKPAKLLWKGAGICFDGMFGEHREVTVTKVDAKAMTAEAESDVLYVSLIHSSKQENDDRDCWVTRVVANMAAIREVQFT